MEKWRLKSCIHLTIPEIPKNTTNTNIYQCPESIQSIHPFSTTYLCLCRGGSFSREAQTCLTPATFFTSSGRTMSHSQASWEIKFLKWVRGLPQDIFPVRQKTLPRRYPSQMPEPPTLYSKSLSDNWAPNSISKEEPSHLLKENNFNHF